MPNVSNNLTIFYYFSYPTPDPGGKGNTEAASVLSCLVLSGSRQMQNGANEASTGFNDHDYKPSNRFVVKGNKLILIYARHWASDLIAT